MNDCDKYTKCHLRKLEIYTLLMSTHVFLRLQEQKETNDNKTSIPKQLVTKKKFFFYKYFQFSF